MSRTVTESDLARFWAKVDRSSSTTGCWEWTGSRHPRGHGQFGFGRSVKAHRFIYEAQVGPIPAGMVIMHTCDNPPCVNPAHLRAGTQADNVTDMVTKGRRASTQGQRNGRSKLTPQIVAQIREIYAAGKATQLDLAAHYGVGGTTIWRIVHGQSWNHPEGDTPNG